ncbi:MAG: FG-GAP repeat protein, partial [Planctomycetes bacterium]|nr:FG-GAP repeat protein [Planctomycetota bacterium]
MSRIPCAKALVLVGGATVVAALAVARTAAVLPTFTPAWVGGSAIASGFGHSVSFAGDVNGDGFDDVVVGAPWFASGQLFEGKAFAYHGSATGLSPTPNWSIENDVAFATVGSDVAGVGDVNGDGYDDVVVGAEQYSNGQQYEGRAQLFLGSATGLAAGASWAIESNDAGSHFGADVAAAGDVNNDGFCDVIVGAPESNAGGTAYVYHGGPAGLPLVASSIRTGPHFDAAFAFESNCAGDVDGDGFDDVVVGVPGFTNGQQGEGGAFVYAGSATGLGAAPLWTTESNLAGMWLGLSVGDGGDFNADGYSDFAIGTWLYEADKWKEGRVEVYEGSPSGPSAVPVWTQVGGQVGASYGSSLANAGDVNGDGIDDL